MSSAASASAGGNVMSGLLSSAARADEDADVDGVGAGFEAGVGGGTTAPSSIPKESAGSGAGAPVPRVDGFAGDSGKSESRREPGAFPPKNASGVRRAERRRAMMAYTEKETRGVSPID